MRPPIGLLLAHQGGWDEILMVAGPLLVVGGLLALANKRARAHLAAVDEAPQPRDRGDGPSAD